MRQPILILSAWLGTPENAGVTLQFRPHVGHREGRGEAVNSDFVTFVVRAILFACFVQFVYVAPFKVGFLMSRDDLLPKAVGKWFEG